MKKRILCLLLAMLMLVSALTALTSCGGDDVGNDNPCANGHVNENADGKCDVCGTKIEHTCKKEDKNNDGKCDVCGKTVGGSGGDEGGDTGEYPEVPWINDSPVELFFMMTHNSNGENLPSGCERYLAGEDTTAKENIDDEVSIRNSDAEYWTNVKVKYDYYEDVKDHDWGKCIELMYTNVKTNPKGAPDIYCNFTYDMVGTSLKGTFANLKNTKLDKGNFFSFLDEEYDESVDDRGYMYEYMESVTLSQEKMYVLASDYFIDLIRAFYVVPVNVELLERVGGNITGDLDGNGTFTIDDFYLEVQDRKWTYDKVITYSNAIYSNTGTSNAAEDIEDVLGFALTLGFSSSGIIYSTDITVIEKKWNATKNDYDYEYPPESPELYLLFDNISKLVTSPGVYVIRTDPNTTKYGATTQIAVRERFCDNKILFGNIIMLGALEIDSYQKLKDSSGFGVVPVPLYRAVGEENPDENYLTSIHNVARPGGIARTTKNFTACTAFLDYQSTHSTHILDEYYDFNLQYNIADGKAGTVEMLRYIRQNVRSAFDKTFEDAIGVYNAEEKIRWSYILEIQNFNYDIRQDYIELAKKKGDYLDTLYNEYPNLP